MAEKHDMSGAAPSRDGSEPENRDSDVGRESVLSDVLHRPSATGPRTGDELRMLALLSTFNMRGRFERLSEEDWASVQRTAIAAVLAERARTQGDGPDDLRLCCALFEAALAIDREHWARETRLDPEQLDARIAAARRHVRSMPAQRRELFLGMGLLEATFYGDGRAPAVAACLSIAHAMHAEAVRQHVSRGWQGAWGSDRKGPHARQVAQRFVIVPPTVEAWRVARAFVDAVFRDPGLARLQVLLEKHARLDGAATAQQRRITRVWAGFTVALDASPRRPSDVATTLHARSVELHIDDCLVMGKLAQVTWKTLLARASTPASTALPQWRALLEAQGFGPEVLDVFAGVEAAVACLSHLQTDVEAAWDELCCACEQMGDFLRVRDEFLNLVRRL